MDRIQRLRSFDQGLILGDAQDDGLPKVFTVVNECYEVSLQLLSEAVEGVSTDHVNAFVNSTHIHSNDNKKAYANKDFESLRAKAQQWFKDEYAFYGAAVNQFKKYLAASKIDRTLLEGCAYWDEGIKAN